MTAIAFASTAARRTRPVLVYVLVVVVGAGAFLYPFWLPQHRAPERGPLAATRRSSPRSSARSSSPRSRSRCGAAR